MIEAELPDGTILEFPDGTAPAVIQSTVKRLIAQRRPEPQGIDRTLNLTARGVGESTMGAIGAIPDLVGRGLNAIDPSLGPSEPDFYSSRLKRGLVNRANQVGRWLGDTAKVATPTTTGDKFAYGVGHGIGDAASVMIPAGAVARTAQVGSTTANVAKTLASQPALQTAAGSLGGGVTEATDNPVLGFAASVAAPIIGKRLVTPLPSVRGEFAKRLVKSLQEEGVPLRPAEVHGRGMGQTLKAVSDTLPVSSQIGSAFKMQQQRKWNQAVLRKAGIAADQATPDVLNGRSAELGQTFERLAATSSMQLDRQFLGDLRRAVTEYQDGMPLDQASIMKNFLQRLRTYGPLLTGENYQGLRSQMSRATDDAYRSGKGMLGEALSTMTRALDDLAGRNMPKDMADEWKLARRQWANLDVIKRTMLSNAQAAGGDIPTTALWNTMKQGRSRGLLARGTADLSDLARAGATILKDVVPNSGTPQRQIGQAMLGYGGAAGVGIGAGMMAGPYGAAGVMVPPAYAAMTTLPGTRQYLGNQLLTGPAIGRGPAVSLAAQRIKQDDAMNGRSRFGGAR